MENIQASMRKPTLDETVPVKCEKCGCEVFTPSYLLRKVSRLLVGAKEDAIIPIDTFSCVKCGHVNKEFLPVELQKKETEKKEETNGLIL